MKIAVAPDSFKGTLTASEAAVCIEQGLRKALSDCEILKIPMADGGEGTVQAMVDASGGKIVELEISDPLGRKIKADYGMMGDGTTAIIEMAAASGLPLLSQEERNPLQTSTFGTGELIMDALKKGAGKIIIGIGGSATVDGGSGMACALGAKFLDRENRELSGTGGNLALIETIDISGMDQRIKNVEFLVACDVTNPLLGDDGAAKIYGPQKGATPEMVEILEKGLTNFSRIIRNDLGKNVANEPGAGAAGGLGAGLMAFLNASLKPGIDIVIDVVGLKRKLKGYDLVITGEGQLDHQTAFGKTPAGVARTAGELGIPVIAIGGRVGENTSNIHSCGIAAYFSALRSCMSNEEIGKKAEEMLSECSEQVGRLIQIVQALNSRGRACLTPTERHKECQKI
jgi:glycerate kinase